MPKTPKSKMKKNGYWSENSDGSLCSGYGFFPDGSKCLGCMDCDGRFVDKPATSGELKKIFNKNHTMVVVGGKKINVIKK